MRFQGKETPQMIQYIDSPTSIINAIKIHKS